MKFPFIYNIIFFLIYIWNFRSQTASMKFQFQPQTVSQFYHEIETLGTGRLLTCAAEIPFFRLAGNLSLLFQTSYKLTQNLSQLQRERGHGKDPRDLVSPRTDAACICSQIHLLCSVGGSVVGHDWIPHTTSTSTWTFHNLNGTLGGYFPQSFLTDWHLQLRGMLLARIRTR